MSRPDSPYIYFDNAASVGMPSEVWQEIQLNYDDGRRQAQNVGRVLINLQRSAILKVGFITNPEPRVF